MVDATGRDACSASSHYAIVDEVDNILIDEARTPLIISGPAGRERADVHGTSPAVVPRLRADDDYTVDQKREARRADRGRHRAARAGARHRQHLLDGELRAHALPGGRAQGADHLPARPRLRRQGRRDRHRRRVHRPPDARPPLVDGLHQAVEAKEGVKIQRETDHLRHDHVPELLPPVQEARRHDRHGRDRGRGVLEIYKLDVVVIPTQPPMVREDYARPRLHRHERAKFNAVVEEIEEMHSAGRPVLVGTASIEKSEYLSRAAEAQGHRAPGPERQAARARGAHRRRGRAAGARDDRHEHGRPRHRHHARAMGVAEARRPARHRHRAARVAAHRQPAARPRRPPGRPGHRAGSSSPSRTTSCGGSRPEWLPGMMQQARHGRGHAARVADGGAGDRDRRRPRSRATTSTSASTSSSTTT